MFEGLKGSDRAKEADISDTFEALEVAVEERGREIEAASAGAGRGTESMIVQASWKAFSRKVTASSWEVGTAEKWVGLRDWRAVWRLAMLGSESSRGHRYLSEVAGKRSTRGRRGLGGHESISRAISRPAVFPARWGFCQRG